MTDLDRWFALLHGGCALDRDDYPYDVEPLPLGEARYARLKQAVEEFGFVAFEYDNADGCLLMDVQTANLLVQVADALSPTNRAKFLVMDLGRMVDVAWKVVK